MSAIPLDLIVEILCQLPVKSLLRFRCLSKEFRSMIDDPNFIRRHHNACLETNSNRRIIAQSNEGFTLFSLDVDSADNAVAAAKLPDIPIQNWWYGFTIIGSCHGLLALSTHDRQGHVTAVLWNISTNKLRILPRIHGDSVYFCGCFGFGYDVASDDYKLVRIFGNQSFTKVIVYSLRANSWRWIEDLPDYYSFYPFHQDSGTLVAGTLNWMEPIKNRESTDLIISFNLKSEKFSKLSVPGRTTTNVGEWDKTVNVLGGCLCLSRNHHSEKFFDIWVMKEYGMRDNWTKLFSFSYLSIKFEIHRLRIVRSLIYSKTGEKVFILLNDRKVIRHDLKKEKDEIVRVRKWPIYIYRATISVDSLVSV
ncbi:hypothetical protein JRO89_XS07G0276300 [Xanthoceras sorbifolium]|uniref:F-box domain-containing protein n=1 Tax=Xanthoceras sorbifolium TaxID=99658 RepID=A0ABQ8HVP5_9ROSI|nr:hypothetical protein JRO89_XS07G0276300 [Xanthoceras sorbifolium]